MKSLISKKKQLLKEKKELVSKIKELRKHLQETTYPFDFTGLEPKDDLMWKFVNTLISKGYLTHDFQPTELSLRRDYIRYNNGSTHFDLQTQPTLLLTQKFIAHLSTTLPNPFNSEL